MSAATERVGAQPASRRWLGGLLGWNLFDIVLHIAVDQVEFLRVTSNVVMIVAAIAVLASGALAAKVLPLAVAAFFLLNLTFIITTSTIAPIMIILILGTVYLGYRSYTAAG